MNIITLASTVTTVLVNNLKVDLEQGTVTFVGDSYNDFVSTASEKTQLVSFLEVRKFMSSTP
jgi:hypothetical protein